MTEAARYFFHPGKSQRNLPPKIAVDAIAACNVAIERRASAPDWLTNALNCIDRHPAT